MLSKSPTAWVHRIAKAVMPSKTEMLLIGTFLKTEIVDRTAQGKDADGKSFAPYSEKRAYYWNPWDKQRKATDSIIKKLGGSAKTGIIRDERGRAVARRSGTGVSIKFASYGAFKRALGRAGFPDLTGPRAPHMMQALTVRVAEDGKGVIIGVYGEAAARASGHQYGNPRRGLPQRKFLGATEQTRKKALDLLSSLTRGKIRSVIKG